MPNRRKQKRKLKCQTTSSTFVPEVNIEGLKMVLFEQHLARMEALWDQLDRERGEGYARDHPNVFIDRAYRLWANDKHFRALSEALRRLGVCDDVHRFLQAREIDFNQN